jgi:hypothetical protein
VNAAPQLFKLLKPQKRYSRLVTTAVFHAVSRPYVASADVWFENQTFTALWMVLVVTVVKKLRRRKEERKMKEGRRWKAGRKEGYGRNDTEEGYGRNDTEEGMLLKEGRNGIEVRKEGYRRKDTEGREEECRRKVGHNGIEGREGGRKEG